MKLIFISGPSGSGKTTLSNQIIKKFKNGIVLSTDNYYKTGLISKLLPKFIEGFFDRSISFNNKLFKKDFDFIYKNGISICDRYYNFEKKTIQNILNETNNISFLIVEGIFAKELSIPVVALSQLSRQVEQRDNKKPQLSDLRESGSIEQDADVVMFVFRESYYLENKEPKPATVEHAEWQAKMNEVSNLAELIIGKQRHGPTGNVFLEFEAMFTKFKDTQIN